MEEKTIDFTSELSKDFIDYAYEANSQRAFADARDGLKPGQRACLWEMYEKGYTSAKPHVKSAKISGGVIASWWPHGDASIYDTFARMSQDWIENIPEVGWHGANGSQIISGEPASSRYTEARLAKVTEDGMLFNIKKNNVPMILNFSEDAYMPAVLPAILPRLMVNGCQGIGSTIANSWLPYNLKELGDIISYYVKTGELDGGSLYPDFPTGGIIVSAEMKQIHSTGKGKVILRARTEIKGNSILITDFPYQVYIEPWIDDVKKLVVADKLTGIEEIYNKSSNKKILVEIVCEKGKAAMVLRDLFAKTDLQTSYNANQWALVSKTPKLLNLKQYLDIYIQHNLECIKREYEFDLNKAQARQEIVEGLIKALAHIDDIVALIKKSDSSAAAQKKLIEVYAFTENQAKAIVSMKLGSLARLEGVELNEEHTALTSTIETCNRIISSDADKKSIFLDRLNSLIHKYGSDRKTTVASCSLADGGNDGAEPAGEDVTLVLSGGVATPFDYKVSKRTIKGAKATMVRPQIVRTNTADSLFVVDAYANAKRCTIDKVEDFVAPIAAIPTKELSKHKYICFVTKKGKCNKVLTSAYTKSRTSKCTKLEEGDVLVNAFCCDDTDKMLILYENGCGYQRSVGTITEHGKAALGNKIGKTEILSVGLGNCYYATEAGKIGKAESKDFPELAVTGKGNIITKDTIVASSIGKGNEVYLAGDGKNIVISTDEFNCGRNVLATGYKKIDYLSVF